MSIHTQMMNRISEETKKHQCSSAELEPVEKVNMIAEVGCTEDVKKICQEGTRVTLLQCTANGVGIKEAEVGKAAYVQVLCNAIAPVSVESKFTCISSQGVVQGVVKQKENKKYEIEYVPKVRGRHKLEITTNGLPVPGSPYPVFVKIPPTQLGKPVKVIGGVKRPIDIAINSAGQVLVAEEFGDVLVLDKSGKKLHTFAKSQYHFKGLYGIAVDKNDAIYLINRGSGNSGSSLIKFNQNDHELIKQEQALDQCNPSGISICGELVVVGSRRPGYLHIFHTNLKLDRRIDLKRFRVTDIRGIASDDEMNLYICDYYGGGVHVLSLKGQGELLYSFGKEQLRSPHSIHISGGLVYVSLWSPNKIFVSTKEGKFVASFGSQGSNQGQFDLPSGLVLDNNSFLYVCDTYNDRLQLF